MLRSLDWGPVIQRTASGLLIVGGITFGSLINSGCNSSSISETDQTLQQKVEVPEELAKLIRNPKVQNWRERMLTAGMARLLINYVPNPNDDYTNVARYEVYHPIGVNIRPELFAAEDTEPLAISAGRIVWTSAAFLAYKRDGSIWEAWVLDGIGKNVKNPEGQIFRDGNWLAHIHEGKSILSYQGLSPGSSFVSYNWTESNDAVRIG